MKPRIILKPSSLRKFLRSLITSKIKYEPEGPKDFGVFCLLCEQRTVNNFITSETGWLSGARTADSYEEQRREVKILCCPYCLSTNLVKIPDFFPELEQLIKRVKYEHDE